MWITRGHSRCKLIVLHRTLGTLLSMAPHSKLHGRLGDVGAPEVVTAAHRGFRANFGSDLGGYTKGGGFTSMFNP